MEGLVALFLSSNALVGPADPALLVLPLLFAPLPSPACLLIQLPVQGVVVQDGVGALLKEEL